PAATSPPASASSSTPWPCSRMAAAWSRLDRHGVCSGGGAQMTVVQLPEELIALREAIRTFIQREIAPKEAQYAQEITETGTFAALEEEKRALRKRSAAEGYYSLFMPEEAGGGGVGYLGLVLCVEECMRHGLLLAMPGGVLPSREDPTPPPPDGPPPQEARSRQRPGGAGRGACFALTEPDAGSDATRIRTRA